MNTRDRRIPPYSHLGLQGTLYSDPTESFGQKCGCSLGILFSGADRGSCCGAGEIQGRDLHHFREKWGKGLNPDEA